MRGFLIACLLACFFLTGCASQPKEVPLGPGEVASVPAAASALSLGASTKADVQAALGKGVVVDFVSGYEVWVYREKRPATAELVLLFDPAGILAKTRVR